MKAKINKELLPIKAHYFFFNAGTAPVVPFMPTLARQLGFSTVIVGIIYTVLPIVGMLAKPLFGFIADRYHRHRFFFLLAEIITAISFFCIMFIPTIPQPEPMIELHCHAGVSKIHYCSTMAKCIAQNFESHFGNRTIPCKLRCQAQPHMWNIVCENWLKDYYSSTNADCADKTLPFLDIETIVDMSDIIQEKECLFFDIPRDHGVVFGQNVTMYCPKEKPYFNATCEINCEDDEYVVSQLSESSAVHNSDAVGLYQFWLFFVLLIISWIGMAVAVSIGDAICFAILGDRHHLYGKQRLCGSIGFGIISLIAGILVDKMSGGSETKDYTAIFWMTAVLMAFDVFASSKLQHVQTHLSPNILKDVGKMFLSMSCITFFIWCVFIGLGTALIWNFLFWHLEDLGSPIDGCHNSMKTLEGFAMAIQCFGGELPFFFLSGWILKKIGHVHAMSLVLLGFGVRFILYSLLQNPWWVLPIELLNGITFGLFYATMASYASILAPPGTEATMQGLVGAIFEGIGVSMGSLIGGALFSAVGGSETFEIFGIAAFIGFFVHVLIHAYLKRRYNDNETFGRNGKRTSNVKEKQENVLCLDANESVSVNNGSNNIMVDNSSNGGGVVVDMDASVSINNSNPDATNVFFDAELNNSLKKI